MGFRCAIVGLPNVGKSTLFNALTCAGIEAENFPFCTIEPNQGVVAVPDLRLDCIAGLVQPERVVPTTMEFVDIAGLVAGASRGEGLGNQFLANIRETQAIAHVVRCFEDDNVVHVDGSVDPLRDIGIIDTELALADLETVERAWDKVRRVANAGDRGARLQADTLARVRDALGEGTAVRALNFDERERELLAPYQLLTGKAVMYIANVNEDGFEENPLLDAVAAHAAAEGSLVVPVCNRMEAEIAELREDEKREFLADLGMDEPGLNRVVRAGYRLLNLHTFFTAGPQEARAWTVFQGATAPQAAAVIHTDFQKGFIRAEVIGYDDFVACGGEPGAKEAGKWRLEGKDYIVADGDVVHFRFHV